jgi:FlaA1/EpsC-like NDP-sugar epimerase
VDDNTALRRRRVHAVTVHGTIDELPRLLETLRVAEVLVTVPDAAPERLDAVVAACDAAGVACRFVRREIAPAPFRAGATAE